MPITLSKRNSKETNISGLINNDWEVKADLGEYIIENTMSLLT